MVQKCVLRVLLSGGNVLLGHFSLRCLSLDQVRLVLLLALTRAESVVLKRTDLKQYLSLNLIVCLSWRGFESC